MQNLDILDSQSSWFFDNLLRIARKGICRLIYYILAIIDLKVVSRPFFSPLNLSKAFVFCILKVAHVSVICNNKNLMLTIF